MQHCPTLLDQQCWTIVGQRVQTDATISQQLLAVQLQILSNQHILNIFNASLHGNDDVVLIFRQMLDDVG